MLASRLPSAQHNNRSSTCAGVAGSSGLCAGAISRLEDGSLDACFLLVMSSKVAVHMR